MDQNRRAPNNEYLLQGSVLDDSIDILLHRLRGMCDNSEDGLTKLKEHEIVYSMREGTGPGGVISLRAKRNLSNPELPWTLCYLGNPEVGDRTRPTTVRTCVEVNCSPNVCNFLQELGFGLEFEFISQGWAFRKNRIKATVVKILRVANPQNLDQLVPLSKSHIVEVSTISGSGNEQAAGEVSAFAEQLKPLVNLDKIDPRRLGI